MLARLRLQTTMAHVIVLVSPFEWQLKDWLIKEWNTIHFHSQIIVNVNQEEKKVEKMKTLDRNLDKTFRHLILILLVKTVSDKIIYCLIRYSFLLNFPLDHKIRNCFGFLMYQKPDGKTESINYLI